MKRWRLVPAWAISLFFITVAFVGAHTPGEFSQHYGDSLFEITRNEMFSVELLRTEPLGVGENSIQMIVHNRKDQDVEGARVTVRAFPAGQEQSAQAYVASDLGHGLYSVHHVGIPSPGNWVLAVDVSKGRDEGSAYFEFAGVAGESAQPSTKIKETGRSVDSARGLFQVSYEPRTGKIPVGRVHAWNLTVLDSAGRPVQGAMVIVEGQMAEQRRNMSTKPEVTEASNGLYVSQGMRFNDPGLWVLRFHVFSEKQWDTAEFHLILP
jgi:hypothetical protein